MTKPFDPTKPVETRSGFSARILATDLKPINSWNAPIAAAVLYADGSERVQRYENTGRVGTADGFTHPDDLINVPEKHVRWVNVYPKQSMVALYLSKHEADQASSRERIACLRIEFIEGEGLDGDE